MKRFLLALLSSTVLAGLGVAQQSTNPGANSSAATGTVQPGSSSAGTGTAQTTIRAMEGSGPSCAPKVCVPEPNVKTIQKVHYSSRCEDFCLPKCPGLHHSHTDCQGCTQVDCPACGRVHHRKLLIKKIENIECPGFQCVPREVAGCPAPGCCAGGACSVLPPPAASAPGEVIIVPSQPGK